jgi:hypothetical protein
LAERGARSTTRGTSSGWWAPKSAKKRKELAAELRAIFAATSSREQALGIASEVADRWRGKGHEKVACHLEEHIEECLACLLAFPESQ